MSELAGFFNFSWSVTDEDLGGFFRAILTMSVTGSLFAALLFALKPVWRSRVSKSAQYYLWLIVLAQLLLPLYLNLPVLSKAVASNFGSLEIYSYSGTVVTLRDALDQYVYSSEEEMNRIAAATAQTGLDPAVIEQVKSPFRVPVIDLMMIFWPMGTLLFFGWNMAAYLAFLRMLRDGRTETGLYAETSGRRLKVYRSPWVETPMLVGVFRPRIVLPERELEETALQNILRHEMTHYRRRDVWIKWLATAANAVHWFNPLVYLIRAEINRACEISCDEAVIRDLDTAGRQSYGETLISVVSDSRCPPGMISVTLIEDKKRLKERLVAIMKHRKPGKSAVCASVLLALFIVASGLALGASTDWRRAPDIALPMDSVKLSELPTEEILSRLTAGTDAEAYVTLESMPNLSIGNRFEWIVPASNYIGVYVPAQKNTSFYYQLHFDTVNANYRLVDCGECPNPQRRWHLRALLNALKYLPTEAIEERVGNTPDQYLLTFRGSGDSFDSARNIFYNQSGVTEEHGWLVCLDLTPMYASENGGYHGVGADRIQLFYSE